MVDIQLNNFRFKAHFQFESAFFICALFLLEELSGISEKVLSVLANSKGILEQSGHLFEQWKDILEHRRFIRTNQNILEQFHLY